jgi:FemAB-related protein (PEP-CTERM system-associated)
MSSMKIHTLGPEDLSKVERYIRESDQSTLYHDYRWTYVIGKSFGHKTFYLIGQNDDGAVQGVLPLVHMNSRIFGNFMVSMPFFNYGGVCADTEEYRSLLIEEAIRIAKAVGASHIELRQETPLQNGFPAKTSKVSMRLELSPSPEELMRSFPSKLRSQIRRPQREGMVARIGRFEELDGFYNVFSVNMRKLGTPVLPIHFFRTILDHFPEEAWICSVYKDRIPVASGFLAGFKDRLEIPWASSLPLYNRVSPNMLLYWTCLSFACERGYSIFDFGRSTAGESTYRFKEQWGAKPVQLHWHYWLRNSGDMPDITPRNPKYKLAVEIWQKLPVTVTRLLGPHIIKNIP